MNSIYGVLHHLQMRLQSDKNQKKIGDKEFVGLTACRTFLPISRVMGNSAFGVCIIFGCVYSQITIRKIGNKKLTIFTAVNLLLT